ncbi:hypothetical protein GmHk_09G025590 [Glycine max]|nr:hypothetical protein GmHk_09G025590 [Glycine max]
MATPPTSTPLPPPPSPPPHAVPSVSLSTLNQTRKATQLQSLATRPPEAERPVVHVDPATGKADSPYKKKLRTYLGIVARDKVNVTYKTWKEAKFEIPEASDSRTKKKALAADKDGVEDTIYEKYGISKEKWAQFCQTRRDPSWEDVRKKAQAIQKQNTAPHVLSHGGYDYLEQKLMAEKTKKRLEEAAQSGSTEGVIDPLSPIRRHVKWKMARTEKTGQMTSEIVKEIAKKIDSLEEQASQGLFVPHGRQDLLTAAIGRPEHPGPILRIRSMKLLQFLLHASRRTQEADSTNQGLVGGVDHRKSDSTAYVILQPDVVPVIQSQGLALPPKPEVGPSATRVSTKESCVDPSPIDLETGDSNKCGLYIEDNPSRLIVLGRVYEGSTAVHNILLLHGQVKVGVEEVKDAEAPVPVPTDKVISVGQTLNTFLAWPTHLVKRVSDQLFLKPLQVMWDVTVFGVFNQDFLLYIKHEDFSEIAHAGQCLSISIIQLWILHLTKTSMRAGNSDVYGFLEPQSIQRSRQSQFDSESYMKS